MAAVHLSLTPCSMWCSLTVNCRLEAAVSRGESSVFSCQIWGNFRRK